MKVRAICECGIDGIKLSPGQVHEAVDIERLSFLKGNGFVEVLDAQKVLSKFEALDEPTIIKKKPKFLGRNKE